MNIKLPFQSSPGNEAPFEHTQIENHNLVPRAFRVLVKGKPGNEVEKTIVSRSFSKTGKGRVNEVVGHHTCRRAQKVPAGHSLSFRSEVGTVLPRPLGRRGGAGPGAGFFAAAAALGAVTPARPLAVASVNNCTTS